jgi:hypothetical protein
LAGFITGLESIYVSIVQQYERIVWVRSGKDSDTHGRRCSLVMDVVLGADIDVGMGLPVQAVRRPANPTYIQLRVANALFP